MVMIMSIFYINSAMQDTELLREMAFLIKFKLIF